MSKNDQKLDRRSKVKDVILGLLVVGGALAFAAVAPNAIQLLRYVLPDALERARKTYYINTVVRKLVAQGVVVLVKNKKGQTLVELTPKGRAELERYGYHKIAIPKPKKWDGKYRIIIFDIKETKRQARDELRRWLRELGFVSLQKSVWVHPYPCEEVIIMLKARYRLGHEVVQIIADEIGNSTWLHREFDLLEVW